MLKLGAAVLVAGCASSGSFCTVVNKPLLYDNTKVADYVATHDPKLADRIDAINTYGMKACSWGNE